MSTQAIKVNAPQQKLSQKANPMEVHQYPYSPHRKKSEHQELTRKSSLKQRLDAFIENDFAVLRKGEELAASELQLKYQNPLVLEYVRSIYDEYNITDPLNAQPAYSRLTMTPPTKKTSKKQKMHLMSNQTVKYSSPAHLKATLQDPDRTSNRQDRPTNRHQQQEAGSRQEASEDFDLVDDESSFIRREFQNNTTIRASMSYFDVAHELKEQNNSFADLRTKYNTLENEFSAHRLRQGSRNGLNIVVEEEVRPTLDEPDSPGVLPRIQLPQLGQRREEDKYYLKEMPAVQKASAARREEGVVDESFRYCIGCERPLLHANIKHHESTCRQFQMVFQMPAEEIVKYLKRKINTFEESIRRKTEELLTTDANHFQESSQRMMAESRTVSEQGVVSRDFEEQYEKVIDIGRRWCLVSEEINKVNWFLKIRERIKKEFEL